MIQVDKNITIPKPTHAGGPKHKYPWKTLEIGDSFLLITNNMKSAHPMAWMAGKRYGIKLSVRKTSEGFRVWRIA